MILAEDDRFHPDEANPFWNESSWASFAVPERNICGWVYFFHRPNMKYSVGGVAAWAPGGEHTYDCLAYSWGDTLPLTAGSEVFDFELANGFGVRTGELLRRYSYTFRSARCDLELEWVGVIHPVGAPLHEGVQSWGGGHYEQPGRMSGWIRIGSERIEVDCWSNRDRTWGPRAPAIKSFPRGGTPWAIASADSAFQVFALAPDPDPLVGAVDQVVRGWYLRDGLVGHLTSGTRRVERGPDGRPVRTLIDAVDEHGRRLEAEGRPVNWLRFTSYPFLFEWWAGASWDFDGANGVWGEEQDFMPIERYRRFTLEGE